ncbi:MAG TPA: acetyl-CoA carboxylase carboxyltransferase subunit alpha [Candidatus Anaerostipes excrementavium]|uniref:Acetyl-coenzyme A carboxylase carboxyl transferase subunit alpha n=1 Tax=Candidatus Anaerostipes excrementavium TaxID=2838463 RepID=A0A9D2BAZ0_9FIRM|nr:acetyl-CoA carboxylase carboxyltransferase subunit alpha [Candidatus Anaerostipes excrementavium]
MSSNFTPWERVEISRSPERPTSLDYISTIFDRYMSLHGDRLFGDDKAIVGGLASIGGKAVTVIGQQKGRSTKENIMRNFGMPSPEGYRKSMRLMRQAEKFHRPIILFVDTPGAFCGIEAEEGGVGEAIARNLFEMSNLKVPILSIMIGEGGSGGAIAMAVGNEVWGMENATYSVLSPEGFAAILWKDGSRASEAAKVMKITAQDLKDLGVIEAVIEEHEPACIDNILEISEKMKTMILDFLAKYEKMSPEQIVNQRYERFRKF